MVFVTSCNSLKVHPHLYRNLLPFEGWMVFCCMDGPFCLFVSQWTPWATLTSCATVNKAAVNTSVQIFLWTPGLILCGIYSETELLDHLKFLFLTFLRNCLLIFRSGCTLLHSYQQQTKILYSPHFSYFFIVAILRGMRDHGYIFKGLKLIARLFRTGLIQNLERSMSNLYIVTLLV